MTQPEPQPGASPQDQPEERQQAAEVDIKQLAERVYRLMLADLRLEKARGAQATRRKAR